MQISTMRTLSATHHNWSGHIAAERLQDRQQQGESNTAVVVAQTAVRAEAVL
jgi:hypothetical protein